MNDSCVFETFDDLQVCKSLLLAIAVNYVLSTGSFDRLSLGLILDCKCTYFHPNAKGFLQKKNIHLEIAFKYILEYYKSIIKEIGIINGLNKVKVILSLFVLLHKFQAGTVDSLPKSPGIEVPSVGEKLRLQLF